MRTPAQGEWLPQVVTAIGGGHFPSALFEALRAGFGVDHIVVFTFSRQAKPGTMATVGRIAPRQAQSLSREYVEAGWFRQDPNLSLIFSADAGACTVGGAMALARYTREYRRRFFESAEIVDKVAFSVRVDDDFWIYANFHRLADSGPFDSEDFDALVRHGPVLAACLVRDRELMAGARRLDAGATVFDVLTPREKDVCAAILAGLTLGGVAQSLGISLNTVLTLRRRAYGRLGIATERELVRLSLRPD